MDIFVYMITFLAFGILFLYVMWVMVWHPQRYFDKLRQQIEELGGREVVVKTGRFEREHLTFNVSFRDGQGLEHSTLCKIERYRGRRQLWSTSPAEILGAARQPRNGRLSSKERHIAELTAENQKLQQQLAAFL